MRLFVAIPLEPEPEDTLTSLTSQLSDGRIIDADQYHITLAFLGDCDELQADDLDLALAGIEAWPFEFFFSGLNVFGGDRPRALFAKVEGGDALIALHQKVERAVRAAAIPLAHRKFVPHVTLSQLKKQPLSQNGDQWFAQNAGFQAGPFWATEFVLYQSVLTSVGPEYSVVARYSLGPDWDIE